MLQFLFLVLQGRLNSAGRKERAHGAEVCKRCRGARERESLPLQSLGKFIESVLWAYDAVLDRAARFSRSILLLDFVGRYPARYSPVSLSVQYESSEIQSVSSDIVFFPFSLSAFYSGAVQIPNFGSMLDRRFVEIIVCSDLQEVVAVVCENKNRFARI